MKDLAGKVAVVTGGGAGIGRALGERFAQEGMKVVLADVIEDTLHQTVDEMGAQFPDVTGVVTDVSSYESVEALRDATLAAYGAVHLVCNNAGVSSGSEGHIWEHHTQDWRWSIDVNVFGIIHGINAFLPVMLEQGTEGHVVNTSSGNGGFSPLINSAVYATTKAAVVTITECLWGQLREIDSPVSASVLFPSTRTPGMLNTGIWLPGKNRPDRYVSTRSEPRGSRRPRRVQATHGGSGHGSGVRTARGSRRPLSRRHPRRQLLDHRVERPPGRHVARACRVTNRPNAARLPFGRFDDDAATVGGEELKRAAEPRVG